MRFLNPLALILFSILLLTSCNQTKNSEQTTEPEVDVQEIEKSYLFGFDLDQYLTDHDTIKSGMTWNDLFSTFDVSQFTINKTVELLQNSKFNLKYIVAGKPFTVFKSKANKTPSHLVYEPDALSYLTFKFVGDSVIINKEQRPIEIKEKTVTGVIAQNSNLTATINKSFDSYGMTADLASSIEGVYAWSVDFFKLQVGDKFAIVYDEKTVDGKPYSVDKIKYAWFEHAGGELYAFQFTDEEEEISGFYNELGEEMKRPFLMAPVNYTRISSTYNLGRFHPVLKRMKAHLGTDYAAPTGTPIYTTADGTITHATRAGGNGIYVKVRHNQTYDTQYLHMSKIADGIKPGVRVKQGDVIGYVGQTGLATGPHVCYRFWKNGKQIDPRSEKFQRSEPMKETAKPKYLDFIAPLKEKLDAEIATLKSTSREFEPEI